MKPCSECPNEVPASRARTGGHTCSERCARKRKTKKQKGRRDEIERRKLLERAIAYFEHHEQGRSAPAPWWMKDGLANEARAALARKHVASKRARGTEATSRSREATPARRGKLASRR